MRDITLEETIYINFTTRSFNTGTPTQLAGSPALSVLEANNNTPITAGVSLQIDRASVTGLNQATIIATAANGYEAGKSYSVYISAGTIGGVSVVGEVVGQFTIQSSATFNRLGNPTGASISADIAAVKAETANILSDTSEIGVAGAGLTNINLPDQTMNITGNIYGSIDGVVGLTPGFLDVAVSSRLPIASYTAPPSAIANATQVRTELTTELARIDVATSTRLATAGYTAPDNATIGTIGSTVATNLDATISSRLSAAGYTAPDNASVTAIKNKTDFLPSASAGAAGGVFIAGTNAATTITTGLTTNIVGNVSGSVNSVSSPVALTADYDFAKGTVAITESYRADGTAPTPAQALCELLAHSGEAEISGVTKTIKKFDGTTIAETFTLNSAISPTSITRTT